MSRWARPAPATGRTSCPSSGTGCPATTCGSRRPTSRSPSRSRAGQRWTGSCGRCAARPATATSGYARFAMTGAPELLLRESDEAFEILLTCIGDLTDEEFGLEEPDLNAGVLTNWGEPLPAWRIFWTMIHHDLQHGGEIGVLRDSLRTSGER